MNRPIITAHSGCEGTGIDTMDSIDKALELGADAIEIDIRMDPMGDLRISHDPLSLEDYFKKNPLEDVFRRIAPSSMLINFDIKESQALYKTLDAAHAFGFPTERLIFTGCTTPEMLMNDHELSTRAEFFLNIEEVLKYVYTHRKQELGEELFAILMETPYIIMIDEDSNVPDVYISEAMRIRQKIYLISKTLREKIFEDTVAIYQETRSAAANLPKILLWTKYLGALKTADIPLSIWTVNEPDLLHRCIETAVYNITTRKVQLAKNILNSKPAEQ